MLKMSQREKIAVSFAGGALLLFLIFTFVLNPMLNKRERLQKSIRTKEQQLEEMVEIQQKLGAATRKNESITTLLKTRDPGFSLFSFLEQSANASKVKKHIAYMKPADVRGDESLRQSLVEMKLQSVSLQQLVDFLVLIEVPEKVVAIKRISIQDNKKEQGALDVLLQIISVDEVVEP